MHSFNLFDWANVLPVRRQCNPLRRQSNDCQKWRDDCVWINVIPVRRQTGVHSAGGGVSLGGRSSQTQGPPRSVAERSRCSQTGSHQALFCKINLHHLFWSFFFIYIYIHIHYQLFITGMVTVFAGFWTLSSGIQFQHYIHHTKGLTHKPEQGRMHYNQHSVGNAINCVQNG